MSGKWRSGQARQFARDLLVGLTLSLAVLAFSMAGSCEARSAPVVAAQSGAIVVQGHPIGMRGPLAQHGFEHVLTLHAIGLGKLALGYDEGESGVGETPVQQAQLTTQSISQRRIWQSGFSADDEQPAPSWVLAAMALAFSMMAALTLGLWRNLGRAITPYRGRSNQGRL